jgi:anti-sigma B factor antagonist
MSHDAYPSDGGASGGALRISRSERGERSYLLEVAGELDLQNSPSLRAEVSAVLEQVPVPAHIELDLTGVTFMDSLGLGTLIVGRRICAQLGVRLTVSNPSPFVAQIIELSGFSSQLIDVS